MNEPCDLRAATGEVGTHCEGDVCTFWRVVSHVGGDEGVGCAIKHYQLLGDDGVAVWLLSVKERLDRAQNSTDAEVRS